MTNELHQKILESLGPGLAEWVEPLPPLTLLPAANFEQRIGNSVGKGSSREVFEDEANTTMVIKRCILPFVGANMFEFFCLEFGEGR